MRVRGGPDRRIGGAEEQQAWRSGGGGEVGDAGVVSEEKAAAREERGEVRQGKIARDQHGRIAPGGGEGVELRVVGFAADEQQARLRRACEQ